MTPNVKLETWNLKCLPPIAIHFPRFPGFPWEATSKVATACLRITSVTRALRFPPKNPKREALPAPPSFPPCLLVPTSSHPSVPLSLRPPAPPSSRPSVPLSLPSQRCPRFPPGSPPKIHNRLPAADLHQLTFPLPSK